MRNPQPHIVIVGGGFGGLYAAKALKDAKVQITLVDRRNHHLFQPLLYQVATAGLSPSDIAYPIRAILRRQNNTRILLAEAVGIDPEVRRLILKDESLSYDYLILATGCSHSYFSHSDWETVAPGLKSLEDALEIRRRILIAFERAERQTDMDRRDALLTFVVVGGGPTGVELAGAIAEIARQVMVRDFRNIDPREARIILVEAGSRVLATYPEGLARKAEDALKRIGVEVRLGSQVTDIQSGRVSLSSGVIYTETVLWAAGVEASPLACSLGVPLDHAGRVLVEPDMSVPGHPEIFVIGDLAAYLDKKGKLLPGVCPVAIQEGRFVAQCVLLDRAGLSRPPFCYVDKGTVATIGRAAAVADFNGVHLWGLPAWLAWLFIHIFFLIGFRNRFIVLFEWAWAYLTYQRGARLITGNIDSTRGVKAEEKRIVK
jgi:NADH dehydrogenase